MKNRTLTILSGFATLGAVQIATVLCGLGSTVLWARFMPTETFGEFRVVFSIINFVSTFCLMGSGQLATMAASQSKDGTYAILLRRKIIANALGSLGFVAIAVFYATIRGDTNISQALIAIALLYPLYNVSDIWISWINGMTRFTALAVARILSSALALGAIALVVILGLAEIWKIIFLWMLAQIVLNFFLLHFIKRNLHNQDIDNTILNFAKHTNFAMIFNCLLSLDVIILEHFTSAHEVAIYAIALQFPDKFKNILSIITQVISPYLYRAETLEDRWQDFKKPFVILWLGLAAIGCIGFFVLEPISNFLFTEKYSEAAVYGKWLWLVMAVTAAPSYLSISLQATKRPFYIYIPHCAFPLLSVCLYLALAQNGVAGITTARVTAITALAVFYTTAFCIQLHIDRSKRRLSATNVD